MHLNIYGVFYSQSSHQNIWTGIPAIYRVILLQEYKRTNLVNCITIIA
jgi:hypothetical protein